MKPKTRTSDPEANLECIIQFSDLYDDNTMEGYGSEFTFCDIIFRGKMIGDIGCYNHVRLKESWHTSWNDTNIEAHLGEPPEDKPTLEEAQQAVIAILANKIDQPIPDEEY